MSDNPMWMLSKNGSSFDRPKPMNDAARLVDLQIENEALKAALTAALTDKRILELRLNNYIRAWHNGDLNVKNC